MSVDPTMRVRVQDSDTGVVTEYALSRDNWRHAWAACSDNGGIVMWVPEELMEPHVSAVITSGRKWRKIVAGSVSLGPLWEREMESWDVNEWYAPTKKENT